MNQRKPNRSLWYTLGLGVLLCIAALVVSTGTTFARYRTEESKDLTFAVRELEQARIGVFRKITEEEATEARPVGTEVFQPMETLDLETVNGIQRLQFVIANGEAKDTFSQSDLEVQLRLLATLTFWNGMEPAEIKLTITQSGETETMQAVPTPIVEGTALYYTHGGGWVYTLQDTEGEITWTLPGGDFSYIDVTVTLENVTAQQEGKLSPQITSRVAG